MPRLVLIIYLALVLAVVGQAIRGKEQVTAAPDEQQVRDVPNRGADARDADPSVDEREAAENRAEFARDEADGIAKHQMAKEDHSEQSL